MPDVSLMWRPNNDFDRPMPNPATFNYWNGMDSHAAVDRNG